MSASIELVPAPSGAAGAVQVFVTHGGRRVRVDVPGLRSGTSQDYGGTTDLAVRVELFERGGELVLVVTDAHGDRYEDAPRGVSRRFFASHDGARWVRAPEIDLTGASAIASAQVGSVYGF